MSEIQTSRSTNSQKIGDLYLTINSNGTNIVPSKALITSLEIDEGIYEVPRISFSFGAYSANLANMKEFDLVLGTGTSSVSYPVTVICLRGDVFSGVLVKASDFFDLGTAKLSTSLRDSISTLGVFSGFTGEVVNISTNDSIFRFNESKWSCTKRLLNMFGRNIYWAITDNKIKLFKSDTFTNPKEFTWTNDDILLDCLRTGDNSNSTPDTINNLFYRDFVACIPSVSKYPKDCIDSLMYKKKFRDGWTNSQLSRFYDVTVQSKLDIGDSIRLKNSAIGENFLITRRSLVLHSACREYRYTFENQKLWNVHNTEG